MLTNEQRQSLMAELGGLKRFCLSLTTDPADADDLLQLTVERLLEKGMPEDAHVAKWAYRVCRNLWVDEIRSREVRNRYSQSEVDAEQDHPVSADESAHHETQLDRVAEAMMQLPEEQRLALTLVAVDGRSYAEAAEILEVPVGTIMSRIARARKNLSKRLSPDLEP